MTESDYVCQTARYITAFRDPKRVTSLEMRAEMVTAVLGANVVRFIVPGLILGLSLVLPCTGKKKCEPVKIPLCQGIGYNSTKFPNILNHKTQEEAALEVYRFFPLVKLRCSDDLASFLCSVYAPICTVLETPVPPCRSLCNSARGGCEDLMDRFGFTWPDSLNCDRFPEFGEEFCVGGNGTSEATRQPPTMKRARGKSKLDLVRSVNCVACKRRRFQAKACLMFRYLSSCINYIFLRRGSNLVCGIKISETRITLTTNEAKPMGL